MDCRDARRQLLEYRRGRLDPASEEAVRGHIAGCLSCSHAEEAEHALSDLLERKLPQHPAPISLKLRLAEKWPPPSGAKASWRGRWARILVPAGVAVLLLGVFLLRYSGRGETAPAGETMLMEAVNNHLRILQSQHPMEIESGNFHEVKPWFEGRIDFAPVIPFLGDEEFPLRGGAVGYYIDRRAAVFEYGNRLHAISLFVFPSEGLPWPARGLEPLGRVKAYTAARRGYNVILWRDGGFGYALVSDVAPSALRKLAAKLSGGG